MIVSFPKASAIRAPTNGFNPTLREILYAEAATDMV